MGNTEEDIRTAVYAFLRAKAGEPAKFIDARDFTLATIWMSNEFEPHGRASETWEEVWHVQFPLCYYRPLTGANAFTYRGRTIREAVSRAIAGLQSLTARVIAYKAYKDESNERGVENGD